MCNMRFLGRRYTMAIGALITMTFFFAYTAVRTPAQNLGFACAIGFSLNIYYGCLYAYTPEVLLPTGPQAWYCGCLQPNHGYNVSCHRNLRQHADECPHLYLFWAVYCYGE